MSKKIINNKVYDTSTARFLADWDNGCCGNDFSRCSEELYIKKTGEYFIYGEGGPMTQYAHSCGQNEWSGGWEIKPLTEAEAREWAEEKLDSDEYEEIFGAIPDDADFSDRLKAARTKKGWSRQKMSDETGIPERTIQAWEYGRNIPADYVQRLVLKCLAD